MPRYFFHIRDGIDLLTDRNGIELPEASLAIDECCRLIREVLEEEEWEEEISSDRSFLIMDERGRTVAVLPFTEVNSPVPVLLS